MWGRRKFYKSMCKILQIRIKFVATKLLSAVFVSSLKQFILMKKKKMLTKFGK